MRTGKKNPPQCSESMPASLMPFFYVLKQRGKCICGMMLEVFCGFETRSTTVLRTSNTFPLLGTISSTSILLPPQLSLRCFKNYLFLLVYYCNDKGFGIKRNSSIMSYITVVWLWASHVTSNIVGFFILKVSFWSKREGNTRGVCLMIGDFNEWRLVYNGLSRQYSTI